MELIVQVQTREALDAALEAGVAGVTVNLPRDPDGPWWAEVKAWQAAARGRQVKFYLQWDRLVREEELPQVPGGPGRHCGLEPRRPDPPGPGPLPAGPPAPSGAEVSTPPGAWACTTPPGCAWPRPWASAGWCWKAPCHLKDLALLRRQTDLPLEVVLPHPCPGFGHLCLMDEYLGGGCPSCCQPSRWHAEAAASLLAALEMLPGLSQVGVAAVRLGGVFSQGRPLSRIIELCRPGGGRLSGGAAPGPGRSPGGVGGLWGRVPPRVPPRAAPARPKRPAPPHRIAAPRPPRSGPGPPPPPAASGWRPGTMPRPSPWPRGGRSR